MASFLIDLVLAVMLALTTIFLVLVNKRLKTLKAGREELEPLVAALSKTIDDADASTKRLITAAADASASLADSLDRAKVLQDEVKPLLESCERATVRVEESIRSARALTRRLDERPRTRLTLADLVDEESTTKPSLPAEPDPVPADVTVPAEVTGDAEEDTAAEEEAVAPERARAAIGAFYARLRTIDSGR